MGRRSRRKELSWLSFCVLLAGGVAGCQKGPRQVAPPEIQAVPVAHPVEREVTDFVDFTGRTDAVNSVNIVPRVTGYLVRMPFKEGSEVKKGDLLFEIDPRPYEAQWDQAKAQVGLYQASLELARTTLERYKALDKSTPGAVSKQAMDQYQAAVVEAEAQVDAQKKSLEVYRLNKEFTRIESPIDGQVSRYYLTLGNLVNQDQTLLTTVVSLDPIHVYFDMDERTLLEIRQAIAEGTIGAARTERSFGADRAGKRRGLSAPGHHQFRQQPGQRHHREHHHPRRAGKPPAVVPTDAVAGSVAPPEQRDPAAAAGPPKAPAADPPPVVPRNVRAGPVPHRPTP